MPGVNQPIANQAVVAFARHPVVCTDHVFVDRLVVVALDFSRLRHIHSIWQPQILIVVGSLLQRQVELITLCINIIMHTV